MQIHSANLRRYIPSAAAALLFTALLAQAPHAATVFIRIAPQDVQWEVWWLAILGGVVYAIALESATAYFVWRNKMRWAIAFAAFSIMHNVAYYMPGAWTFDVAGAQLSLRYIVSALLISASLPIAIAAFSHVHVESIAKHDEDKPLEAPTAPATPTDTTAAPSAPPVQSGGHSEAANVAAKPTEQASATSGAQQGTTKGKTGRSVNPNRDRALQMRSEGFNASEIAGLLNEKESTVASWLYRGAQKNGVAK